MKRRNFLKALGCSTLIAPAIVNAKSEHSSVKLDNTGTAGLGTKTPSTPLLVHEYTGDRNPVGYVTMEPRDKFYITNSEGRNEIRVVTAKIRAS